MSYVRDTIEYEIRRLKDKIGLIQRNIKGHEEELLREKQQESLCLNRIEILQKWLDEKGALCD